MSVREKRMSVRLLWPFVRVAGVDLPTVEAYARAGYGPAELVNPDVRVPHRLVMDLLGSYVSRTGDATLGLRAGESVTSADLEPLEYCARGCATLRDAIRCWMRYIHVMNEAAEVTLVDGPAGALLRFRTTDGVPQAPAADDFVLACAAAFARRCAVERTPPREVHVMHGRPDDVSPYARAFGTDNVRFGMPHNGFLLDEAALDRPLAKTHPVLQQAFEQRARELLSRVQRGVRQEVAALVMARLHRGRVSMTEVARELGMSVATLRRRLEEDGTKFSRIVDDARRGLAETHLRNPQTSVSEIAFLLGFSHVPAFCAAFRRWTG